MIHIEKVSKTYRTQEHEFVHAVAEVSLGVRENESVTLVGLEEKTISSIFFSKQGR